MGITDGSGSLLCLSEMEATQSFPAKYPSPHSTFLSFCWKNHDSQGSIIGKPLLASMAQRQWMSMVSFG